MADSTPNLNLVKPAISEKISLAVLNQNMDTIDATLGAPSAEVTDLLNAYNTFNAPWVETAPAVYGMSASTGLSSRMLLFRQGKIVTGRYLFSVNSFTASGAVGFEVALPDNCYPLIGATPLAVGSFTAGTGVNFAVTGAVVMYATAGANSRLRFLASVTKNTAAGPWSSPVGLSGDALWSTANGVFVSAEFTYEAP